MVNNSLNEEIAISKRNILSSSEAITTAHMAFSTHFTSFLSVADKIDQRLGELAAREVAIEKRENDVKVKEQAINEREQKCLEREKTAKLKEQELATKETKWVESEQRMLQNAAKLPSVVQLNVGKFFITVLDIITYM
jgi:uncharacterized protein (DUF3084 family)